MKLTNTAPALAPFWFIRDLMVSVILSPVIYFLIKNLKGYLIASLIILYIFNIPTEYHGLGLNMWFSIGAYLAIFHIDFIRYCNKARWILYGLTALLFISCLLVEDILLLKSIEKLFVCISIFSLFEFANIICNKCIGEKIRRFKGYTFFIFAFHGIIITSMQKIIIILASSVGVHSPIVIYITSPIITISICVFVYKVGMSLMPNIMKIFGCER